MAATPTAPAPATAAPTTGATAAATTPTATETIPAPTATAAPTATTPAAATAPPTAAEPGAPEHRPSVVVLASYHQGDTWTDHEVAGLLTGLRKGLAADDPDLVPTIEYLDTKRFPEPEHLGLVRESLQRKYRDRPVDLVIALDDPAFDLLRTHPRDLFPGVPVVFAGVNGLRPEHLADRPGMTGVAETEDLAGTLALALRLHPRAHRLLVVLDNTASGQAMRRQTEAVLPQLPRAVRVDFAPDVPLAALERQLADLPADALVLIPTYVTDAAGQVFSRAESTRRIARASPVPVYAMHETRLGHGIVGGLLVDGRAHGAQAAALVRRVLDGEDPALIPVQTSHSRPAFDDRELRRFGIPQTALPPGSRIIDRPPTFFQEYRGLVLGTAAVLALLTLTLAVLAVATLRARRAEAAMAVSEAHYRTLFETMAQGVTYQDAVGAITAANPAACRILGLDLDQLQGRTSIDPRWHAIHEDGSPFPGDEHPSMLALRTGREVAATIMGIMNPRAAGYRWLVVHAVPQFRPGEPTPYQVFSTFDDITEVRAAEAALRDAEERLELAVKGADLGLYEADLRTGEVWVNEGYERLLGYAPGTLALTVEGWWDLIHPDDRAAVEARALACRDDPGLPFEAEYRLRHQSGGWRWVLDRGRGFDWTDGTPGRSAGTWVDITERKASEARIGRLSRLYQTLSDTNQAIVRTTEEHALFQQVCDIGLRLAGFGLVWIGLLDRERAALRPVAAAGAQAWAVLDLELPLAGPARPGYTLAADSLAAGQALVCNDWASEHPPRPDTPEPFRHALGSMACLPLFRGGQTAGVLEIGAPEPGYFDPEVVALLTEMAQDLSYAMHNLERARALAESQAQYRRIVETASEGIWSMDAEHRTSFVNPRMAELLGYAPAEMLGRPVESFMFEEDLEAHQALMRHRAAGHSDLYERRFRRQDGSTLWALVSGAPILDEAGRFQGSFGMFTDITSEHAAKLDLELHRESLEETVAARTAELRAAEEHLRLILESSANGLLGLAPDGRLSFANPAACRLLGYPAETLVGSRAHELFHQRRPDGRPYPAEACPIRATLKDGETIKIDDEVFWRADGQAMPVIYSAHPMLRDGAIVGAVMSFVDITERRQLEERLRELATAVEAIAGTRDLDALAAIVCAAARRLTGADGAALALREGDGCRYVGEDAIGPLWRGQRFPLEASAAGWVIRHAAPMILDDPEADPRVPSDHYRGTFVRALCVMPIGRTQPLGAVGCYWAEPGRRAPGALELAQALADAAAVGLANLDLIGRLTEARAVAERLAQVKGLFLANMSHEIRTPMNAIVGLAHLLGRGLHAPEQQAQVAKITDAANHLLAILNDILDFSKIEAGRLELEESDFDLTALLTRACALVAEQARVKGLDLRLDLDPALAAEPHLRGDPTRLTQLLLNYLSNAIKFTERGTVTVSARPVGEDADIRLLHFAVKDTGSGISPADQGRLFDAFEQLDPSTTRRHGGTGLGLAINWRLAQLMGGSVGVDSSPGQGSTFWFTVRLRRGATATGPGAWWPPTPVAEGAEALLRRDHAGARVLLAEDNPINQEVALDLLRDAGLTADLAADGTEALARARETRYDLILMDMQMPVLDGLEATRLIRELPGYGATPILALTANAFGDDRARCLAAGMNDHLGKPVEPASLYAALVKWLGRTPDAPAPPPATPSAAPVGAPAGSTLSARLAAIPGLDGATALHHVGGREERLVRALRVFDETSREAPATLRELLAAGDTEGARRLAHGLKGAAATLGAEDIANQARELEQALGDGALPADLEPPIARLETDLTALLGALRAALDA